MSGVSELQIQSLADSPRRRQAITYAFWAISAVLHEQHVEALTALTHAQRTGADLGPAAARLSALADLRALFESQLLKEPLPA